MWILSMVVLALCGSLVFLAGMLFARSQACIVQKPNGLTRLTLENIPAQAKAIGDVLGVDWQVVDLQQFIKGLAVELEHGSRDAQTNVTHDDPLMTGKIALAHLKEFADYYTRLEKVEEN